MWGNKSFHSDFRRRSHLSHQTYCYLCSINQHEHESIKPRDESKVMTSHQYLFLQNNLLFLETQTTSL